MRGKGQVSTLLKPIQVLIFVTIFVTVIGVYLNFDLGLMQQSQSMEFRRGIFTDYQRISSCLSPEDYRSPTDFVLSRRKLEKFDRRYPNRQLPCAHIYNYGYNVSVEQRTVRSLTSTISGSQPADVVIALDDSGSMGGYISQVKANTEKFIEMLPAGSRVGLFTYASPAPGSNTYIANEIKLTRDESKVLNELEGIGTDGGDEPEDLVINYTMHNFTFRNPRKILIILATEGANTNLPTGKKTQKWAKKADKMGLEIYPISDRPTVYKKIAKITGGKRYPVTSDYSKIFEDIAGQEKFVGNQDTCTLPPVKVYNGTLDIVYAGDASSSNVDEWYQICNSANRTATRLERLGLNVSVSIYAPGNPYVKMDNDADSPMEMPDDLAEAEGGVYNFTSSDRNVTWCMEKSFNNATVSSYGKGITKWEGPYMPDYNMPDYKKGEDFGIEAWGVFSKWIIKNHDWRKGTDLRLLNVFGDTVPSGGNTYMKGRGGPIQNETELVRNLTSLAVQKGVQINMYRGASWQYSGKDKKKPYSMNDAKILMKNASRLTGGKFKSYSAAPDLAADLARQFMKIKAADKRSNFCDNLKYTFGQQSPETVRRSSAFPVSIKINQRRTAGLMKVKAWKGPLTTLSGEIQQVIDRGKRTQRQVSSTIRFDNSRPIRTVSSYTYEIPVKTKYTMTDGSGSPRVTVTDNLIIGIDGNQVAKAKTKPGESEAVLDFSNINFTAYKGSTLQHIAVNDNQSTGMKLEPLTLECVSGCGKQVITSTSFNADKGSERYKELGKIGVFEYNSTTIRIGKTREITEPAICLGQEPNRRCNTFNISAISSITLQPGSHIINLEYFPEDDQLVINN